MGSDRLYTLYPERGREGRSDTKHGNDVKPTNMKSETLWRHPVSHTYIMIRTNKVCFLGEENLVHICNPSLVSKYKHYKFVNNNNNKQQNVFVPITCLW